MNFARSILFLCAAALVTAPCTRARAQQTPINVGDHRQLFVDDYVIAEMEGVRRVVNQPTRHPANPLVRVEHPWEGDLIDLYGSVLYDEAEGVFKMWYARYSRPLGSAGCYATSTDGIEWRKPDLGLVDFEGSRANNLIPWFGMGMIYSPEDPDANARYKALAGRRAIVSSDGLTWQTPPGSEPIPGDLASDNVIPFCYDELRGRYLAFPKVVRRSGEHKRRSVSLAISDDFLAWTAARTILVPDARDDDLARERLAEFKDRVADNRGPELHNTQFYGMSGFPYEGLYLGMLWVFDVSGFMEGHPTHEVGGGGEDGITQVELTCSRDLEHWERVGSREVFVPLGAAGAWDGATIYTANRPLIVGDEIWIYYGAHGISHAHPLWHADADHERIAREAKARGPISGVGLARLRLDGWVSMDAGAETGSLTTKPMRFEGNRRLLVNGETRRGGSIAVEILDAAGNPLPGYGRADCDAFTGDSVRHVVAWEGESDLFRLAGTPLRLRFWLQDAKLYSFVFQD